MVWAGRLARRVEGWNLGAILLELIVLGIRGNMVLASCQCLLVPNIEACGSCHNVCLCTQQWVKPQEVIVEIEVYAEGHVNPNFDGGLVVFCADSGVAMTLVGPVHFFCVRRKNRNARGRKLTAMAGVSILVLTVDGDDPYPGR